VVLESSNTACLYQYIVATGRASAYSLEFTELEAEISSAKMPDILAHILGQIGANMPVILKYPQNFLTRTKKVKNCG
jgi:hypothetical protein